MDESNWHELIGSLYYGRPEPLPGHDIKEWFELAISGGYDDLDRELTAIEGGGG